MAPCSRSKISGGMSSTRSTMAAARASVARASRFSSSVRVSDPQGQDLVDLGRVEQVARALGGHLGVVVQDDRRRQHDGVGVGRPPRPSAREGAEVLAGGGDRLGELGRVDAATGSGHPSRRAGRARRPASRRTTSSRGASGTFQLVWFSTRTRTLTSGYGPVHPVGVDADDALHGAPFAHEPSDHLAAGRGGPRRRGRTGGRTGRPGRPPSPARGDPGSRPRCRARARPPRPRWCGAASPPRAGRPGGTSRRRWPPPRCGPAPAGTGPARERRGGHAGSTTHSVCMLHCSAPSASA